MKGVGALRKLPIFLHPRILETGTDPFDGLRIRVRMEMQELAVSGGVGEDNGLAVPVLTAARISKTYGSGDVAVHALQDVDFELLSGELVVLLGASGSGKSTLLNILGGLDRATSGDVYFQSSNLTTSSDTALTRYRRDHVGFVFQFYNLIPSLTALENVLLVTEIAGHPMTAESALEMVQLSDRMHHFPAQLSGGEQQRVAIARAIAKRPNILLCDEPTGALDSQTGILVLEAINRINRELGTATIVITHNIATGAMADRVVTLTDGRVSSIDSNAVPAKPSDIHW